MDYFPIITKPGEISGVSVFATDITERVKIEKGQRLTAEIFSILNNQSVFKNAVQEILIAIQRATEVEAIGIRLKEGEDFPFFIHHGFSEEFIRAECDLIASDGRGNILRNKKGGGDF